MRIIGVDCSTSEAGVAVAVGVLDGDVLEILPPVVCGGPSRSVLDVVVQSVGRDHRCLLAFDAPLGWPAKLGSSLTAHTAGEPLTVDSNLLFRRGTDRFIKQRTGQQPLDVGADRIARTAHWALSLLGALRQRLGVPIPLSWGPGDVHGLAAIEVYPAASLRVRGISTVGYKKKEQGPARASIAQALRAEARWPDDQTCLTVSADALDSAICVIAGADYIRGLCMSPSNVDEARREGWIWVRNPHQVRSEA